MTVKRAIEVLQKLPLDAVLVTSDKDGYSECEIAGKPQEHLVMVDVWLVAHPTFAMSTPGKKVVIVD